MTENDTSDNNSENFITRKFPVVPRCSKPAAKSAAMLAMLASCFYFAYLDPACRPVYVQVVGGVVSALLSKPNK